MQEGFSIGDEHIINGNVEFNVESEPTQPAAACWLVENRLVQLAVY